MLTCKLWVTADVAFCSASIYSLIGVCIDRFQALADPLAYAERLANRNMRRTTLMILGAWCMALVICLPMHINAPGFANFDVTEKTAEDCMPPVFEDSKEIISNIYSVVVAKFERFLCLKGFVLYSSNLAFFIPFVAIGFLQFAIFYKRSQFQNQRVNE